MLGLLLFVVVLGGAFVGVRYLEKGEEERRALADKEREAHNALARPVAGPAASPTGPAASPVRVTPPPPSHDHGAPPLPAAGGLPSVPAASGTGIASVSFPAGGLPSPAAAPEGRFSSARGAPAEAPRSSTPEASLAPVLSGRSGVELPVTSGVLAPPAFERLEAHVEALELHLLSLKTDLAELRREHSFALHQEAASLDVPVAAPAPVEQLAARAAAMALPQRSVPPLFSDPDAAPVLLRTGEDAAPVPEPADFDGLATGDAWAGSEEAPAWQAVATDGAASEEGIHLTRAGSGDPDQEPAEEWGAPIEGGSDAPCVRPGTLPSGEPSLPLLELAWQWLCGLGVSRFIAASNIWALVGIGIMLMGVVLLVRYAATIVDFGPVPRLSTAGVVGFVLLALGWRQQGAHRELGLILQGGGVGSLYLTVFAGMRFYELIPAPLAFGLLVGIVIFSTFLAIVQNAKIMAHVAYGAGFMAPVLVSANSGNYIGLFSYYILLNLGIIAVSRYKNWRSLHVTGFLFTVAIGGLWGMRSYTPDKFLAVEGFLAAFFFIFTYFALAGSHPSRFNWRERSTLLIDVPVTLGTPLAAILFQAAVVRGIPFALAFSSLFLGFFYLSIAWYLFTKSAALAKQTVGSGAADDSGAAGAEDEATQATAYRQGFNLLVQIYLVLGVLFANLTLPFALYDMSLEHWRERLLSLIWVVEGACVFWLGCRNRIPLFRYIGKGSLAIGLALLLPYFLMGAPDYNSMVAVGQLADGTHIMEPVLDYGRLLTSLTFHLFTLAGLLASAYSAWKFPYSFLGLEPERLSQVLLGVFAAVATAVFTFDFASLPYSGAAAMLLLFTVFGFLAGKKAEQLGWRDLRLCALLPYLPFVYLGIGLLARVSALLLTMMSWGPGVYDMLSFSWVWYMAEAPSAILFTHVIIVGFCGLEFLVLRSRVAGDAGGGEAAAPPLRAWRYPLAFNILALLLFHSTFYYLDRVLELAISTAILRLLALVWCVPFFVVLLRWLTPETVGRAQWLRMSLAPLLIAVGWFFGSLLWDAGPSSLVHLPLLNTVEVGLICCLALVYLWARAYVRGSAPDSWLRHALRMEVLLGVVFVLLNLSVLRATATWEGLPFTVWDMLRNPATQAYLAILWAVCGFSTMLYGHKRRSRQLWLAGGALILLDVAKLLIFEVKRMETLWLIVALFVVGGLLLAISYYMPTPPMGNEPEDKETEVEK